MQDCMFCLESGEDVFQLQGTCECRPLVHMKCVKGWFEYSDLTCPICLKKYAVDESEEDVSYYLVCAQRVFLTARILAVLVGLCSVIVSVKYYVSGN